MYHHRADRDDTIDYLAKRFPKCFFEEPGLRRPLKVIVRGLESDYATS